MLTSVLYRIQLWQLKRAGLKVGAGTRLIAPLPSIGEPYLVEIGNHVTVSSDCIFLTHDGAIWAFKDRHELEAPVKFGRIQIGDGCFIGARAILLPNVLIGDGSIVAAGSVVTKNVPDGLIVAGNPAREVGRVEDYMQKCLFDMPNVSLKEFRKRVIVEGITPRLSK